MNNIIHILPGEEISDIIKIWLQSKVNFNVDVITIAPILEAYLINILDDIMAFPQSVLTTSLSDIFEDYRFTSNMIDQFTLQLNSTVEKMILATIVNFDNTHYRYECIVKPNCDIVLKQIPRTNISNNLIESDFDGYVPERIRMANELLNRS